MQFFFIYFYCNVGAIRLSSCASGDDDQIHIELKSVCGNVKGKCSFQNNQTLKLIVDLNRMATMEQLQEVVLCGTEDMASTHFQR